MVAEALPALATKTSPTASPTAGSGYNSGPSQSAQPMDWASVPGWPSYEVSTCGQVRRHGPATGAVVGRVLRQLLNPKTGYRSVCLSAHSVQKRVDVHRLVAMTFLGPQPSARHLVAHNDGIRTNNCVTNLRWATQAENLSDCRAHGTALVGSRNPMAAITELDVRAIRRMKAFGIPRAVIADGYGIHLRSVFRILSGMSWEHVQ